MRHFPALIGFVVPILLALPAHTAALSKEQTARFDQNQDRQVDPEKALVYARHLYDKNNILADYDTNLNGQIDLEELDSSMRTCAPSILSQLVRKSD